MTDTMVRVKLENGAEVSVPSGFAERRNLKPIPDTSAFSKSGQVLGPSYPEVVEAAVVATSKLRGKALTDALTEAGLSDEGSLAERQERLGAHEAAVATQAAGNPDNPGGNQPGDTPGDAVVGDN